MIVINALFIKITFEVFFLKVAVDFEVNYVNSCGRFMIT